MEDGVQIKYFNETIRCYKDGTIERKVRGWGNREEYQWKKVWGRLIKIDKKNYLRNRIIAKCFLEIPEDNKYQVRYKNGNDEDNSVDNLEVCSIETTRIRKWEGIKSYTVQEEGKTVKRFKVMCNGVFGRDDICAMCYAKYHYDTMLGKKWVWRIITKDTLGEREKYLERGRAKTQEEAEITGKWELLRVQNTFMCDYNKELWILDVYEEII